MIVQELMPHGSLSDYLKKNKAIINPNVDFEIWQLQIARGMMNKFDVNKLFKMINFN